MTISKNIPALIKINSSLSSCALFQQPSNGRVQFVSSSATPWQFCRDRRNATSAWSSYITALLKAILWSNQIEKYQLMVSAGEPPVLRSWPRPTKSRRHLTLKEREVLFLSQERDKWSAWMSDSWSTWKYFISHSLPHSPSVWFTTVWPLPCLPAPLSLLIYPGQRSAARAETEQIWASSFPPGADQRPAQGLLAHTHCYFWHQQQRRQSPSWTTDAVHVPFLLLPKKPSPPAELC